MKVSIKLIAFILSGIWLIQLSCKKAATCANCAVSDPPIAIAGKDTAIILPIDSLIVDGSASYAPNGTIKTYEWKKIAGPGSYNIVNTTIAKTVVKQLTAGVYQFELKVTDNSNLSSKDTIQVVVTDPAQPNRPPVAHAGYDREIALPLNSVTLDGSTSSDPDNNIISYTWKDIAGPSVINIPPTSANRVTLSSLIVGTYQFELEVTDAGGLSSKDTIQVKVTPPITSQDECASNRPLINAQLLPLGILSQSRWSMSIASAGNKILFAGGFLANSSTPSSRVDIYDIASNTWSTTELSIARGGMAVAVIGNKIFFGGGDVDMYHPSSRVDIYDVASGSWSTAELSQARSALAAGVAGNKVVFGGGYYQIDAHGTFLLSNKVDIFDVATNLWSTASLTEPREELTATTVDNKIYFAGGTNLMDPNDYGSTANIDVYDAVANTWSTAALAAAKGAHAAIAVNNIIYWAGGRNLDPNCNVEIRNVSTQTSSFAKLSQPNAEFNAVSKNDQIVFFTVGFARYTQNENQFDIYNTTTNTWSIGLLNQTVQYASILSVNNTIYVAGGYVNGVLSNQVYKLSF